MNEQCVKANIRTQAALAAQVKRIISDQYYNCPVLRSKFGSQALLLILQGHCSLTSNYTAND